MIQKIEMTSGAAEVAGDAEMLNYPELLQAAEPSIAIRPGKVSATPVNRHLPPLAGPPEGRPLEPWMIGTRMVEAARDGDGGSEVDDP